jgi:hypothetical protein
VRKRVSIIGWKDRECRMEWRGIKREDGMIIKIKIIEENSQIISKEVMSIVKLL